MRPSPPRLFRGLAWHLPCGVLALLACSSAASCAATTDTTTTTSVVPTSITVDPATFLGSLVCSNAPGSLRSYVATLTDVTKGKPQVTLGSSPPTPCSQTIDFRYVALGHEYIVAIDGYEQAAGDLAPCGGPSSGSRYMLKAPPPSPTGGPPPPVIDCAVALQGGAVPITPRWKTDCGSVAGTKPTLDESIVVSCNVPLDAGADADAGSMPLAPAGITVDPTAALGPLSCAERGGAPQPGGTITRFDIKPEAPGLTTFLGVACGSEPTTYAKDLVPGTTYTFDLAAHATTDPTPSATYHATCSLQARAGFTLPAVCSPFTHP